MGTYWDDFLTKMKHGEITNERGHSIFIEYVSPCELLELFFEYLKKQHPAFQAEKEKE